MLLNICQGICFAGFFTLLALLIRILLKHRIFKNESFWTQAVLFLMLFWALMVLYLTILIYTYDPAVSTDIGFTPLHTFREIYLYHQKDLSVQIVCNIIMFMPIGFLLPCWKKEYHSASIVFTAGFALSLCIECMQLFIGRSFDFDDILCNALGALVGYGVFDLCQDCMLIFQHKKITGKQAAKAACTLLALVLLIMYPVIIYMN